MISFSVICPIYNAEKFLEKAVNSVINQTYKNWELVLINDGSIDNSGSICEFFSKRDKRIKVIHQENQGQSKARLAGLEKSVGEYILFLDSDDFLIPNALERISNQLEENEYDIVMFDAIKSQDKKDSSVYALNERKITTNKKQIMSECFVDRIAGYLWTYCFKKNLFNVSSDVINRFGEIKYSEDVYLIYQVIKHNAYSLLILPEPLYIYVVNEESITHTQTVAKVRDRFAVFNDVYKDLSVSYNLTPKNSTKSNIGWTYFSFLSRAAKEYDFANFKATAKEIRSSYIFKHLSRFKKDKYTTLIQFLLKIRMYKRAYAIIRNH